MHEETLILILMAGYLLELLLTGVFWAIRKPLAWIVLGLVAAATVYLLVFAPYLAPVLAVFPFRVVNMLKIVKGRSNPEYLRVSVRRSSFRLLVSAVGVAAVTLLAWHYQLPAARILTLIALAQVTVALGLLMITYRNVTKTKQLPSTKNFSDQELPTVTVAIPARNESGGLVDCINSVLASDYPKMEIIVLDDCSHDSTADIIKDFAHKGVRFIQGEQPHERWLPKNWAYQRLAESASGEFVLFCGVDVRFDKSAIRKIVILALTREKTMVGVLPARTDTDFVDSLIQPMRYWWELALPRRLLNRPAALSTCWLINRTTMLGLGGFKSVSGSVLPEGYFAREIVKTDGYSFVRSSKKLGVSSVKELPEQRATAIRQRYPQLRRRPENVMVLLLFEFIFLFGPAVIITVGIVSGNLAILVLGLAAYSLLLANHALILSVIQPRVTPLDIIGYPVVALTEMVICAESMLLYEFSEVQWKSRNVCLPPMHAIPRLPKLPEA